MIKNACIFLLMVICPKANLKFENESRLLCISQFPSFFCKFNAFLVSQGLSNFIASV